MNLRSQSDNTLKNLLRMYQRQAVEGINADVRRDARMNIIDIQAEQRRRRLWKQART